LLVVAKIPTEVAARFAGRKIECVALVFDEKENLANLQRLETDLTKSLGMDVIYLSESSLQPGNYKCRLVIRDLENGQAAVASAQVNIPAPPSTGLKLHTPLLLVPGSNSLYLEPEVKKGSRATWDDAYPYLRTRYSPLIGEVSPGTSNIFTLIPCSFPGLGSPEISMTAWLIETATGARIPISGSILDRLPNVTGESILAEISLEHIAAGRYRLYLQATDTISKALSYTQTLLVIR
jgi:hypothetical protein